MNEDVRFVVEGKWIAGREGDDAVQVGEDEVGVALLQHVVCLGRVYGFDGP